MQACSSTGPIEQIKVGGFELERLQGEQNKWYASHETQKKKEESVGLYLSC